MNKNINRVKVNKEWNTGRSVEKYEKRMVKTNAKKYQKSLTIAKNLINTKNFSRENLINLVISCIILEIKGLDTRVIMHLHLPYFILF